VIAVAGTIAVARLASLDIGFVRSHIQVGCLEAYADYPRAHLSQYSALYTSLSTGYDLEMANPTCQALPFAGQQSGNPDGRFIPATIRRSVNNRLQGFQVQSNSTGLLHAEMMFDLQGTFSIEGHGDGWVVQNGSLLDLNEVAIVRRTDDEKLEAAWVGTLPSGALTPKLTFVPLQNVRDAWSGSKLLTCQELVDSYLKPLRSNESNNNDEPPWIAIETLRSVPELQKNWDDLMLRVARTVSPQGRNARVSTIEIETLRQIILEMENEDQLNVSQIFEAVAKNLAVAPGEMRLMGVTNQAIGANDFSPAATQSQQQTLVVVHLKRPPLPVAVADQNSLVDLLSKSDLDWLLEELDTDEDAGKSEEQE
jgi:hypothetical protein